MSLNNNYEYFHETDHSNDTILEDQNDIHNLLPDSPVVQLLKSNVTLSLDTTLTFENWEEVELFMDAYSE